MNVLGEPIDEAGPIGEEERYAIHRAAPSYEDQSNSTELLETVLRLSTLFVLSLKVVKSVCSVVLVLVKQST